MRGEEKEKSIRATRKLGSSNISRTKIPFRFSSSLAHAVWSPDSRLIKKETHEVSCPD